MVNFDKKVPFSEIYHANIIPWSIAKNEFDSSISSNSANDNTLYLLLQGRVKTGWFSSKEESRVYLQSINLSPSSIEKIKNYVEENEDDIIQYYMDNKNEIENNSISIYDYYKNDVGITSADLEKIGEIDLGMSIKSTENQTEWKEKTKRNISAATSSRGSIILDKNQKKEFWQFLIFNAIKKQDSSILSKPESQKVIKELTKNKQIEKSGTSYKFTKQGDKDFEKKYLEAKRQLEKNRIKMNKSKNQSYSTEQDDFNSTTYYQQVGNQPSDMLLDLLIIGTFSGWLDTGNMITYALTGSPTMAIAYDWLFDSNNNVMSADPSFMSYSQDFLPASVFEAPIPDVTSYIDSNYEGTSIPMDIDNNIDNNITEIETPNINSVDPLLSNSSDISNEKVFDPNESIPEDNQINPDPAFNTENVNETERNESIPEAQQTSALDDTISTSIEDDKSRESSETDSGGKDVS